ncbi:MAG TPA: hypothetical protein VGO31_14135 [Microbacteriaceae bacterium]|nr:hypothetical protein [Microbacteriaceae bacterium]
MASTSVRFHRSRDALVRAGASGTPTVGTPSMDAKRDVDGFDRGIAAPSAIATRTPHWPSQAPAASPLRGG